MTGGLRMNPEVIL